MFKVGDKVSITEDNAQFAKVLKGDIGVIIKAKYADAFEVEMEIERSICKVWSFNSKYLNLVELDSKIKIEVTKSVCNCDSRQLFNFGHEKTCIERKI